MKGGHKLFICTFCLRIGDQTTKQTAWRNKHTCDQIGKKRNVCSFFLLLLWRTEMHALDRLAIQCIEFAYVFFNYTLCLISRYFVIATKHATRKRSEFLWLWLVISYEHSINLSVTVQDVYMRFGWRTREDAESEGPFKKNKMHQTKHRI